MTAASLQGGFGMVGDCAGLCSAPLPATLPGGTALAILALDPVGVSASPTRPPCPQLGALENLPSQV